MKITKIVKKKINKYEIILDNSNKIELYDDTILKFNLLGNHEIDDKELENITIYNNSLEAYYKALRFLNSKLRTKVEIEKKLKTLGFSKNIVNDTITRLGKEGYINKELYIKSYVSDQISLTLNGPKKITRDLLKLGFDELEITDYLNSIDNETWLERIKKIISKKEKSNHNLSSKMLNQKIKKDLINMGYHNEQIQIVLNDNLNVDEENIINHEIQKYWRKLSRKYDGEVLNNKIKYELYKKGFNLNLIEEKLKSMTSL